VDAAAIVHTVVRSLLLLLLLLLLWLLAHEGGQRIVA
jgi:hypothetical protein